MPRLSPLLKKVLGNWQSLSDGEKLTLFHLLSDAHAKLLFSDNHDGSRRCSCHLAELIRKLEGEERFNG